MPYDTSIPEVVGALVRDTGYASRARSRLAQQLRSSVTHAGVLDALSRQVQAVEDALMQVARARVIDLAQGAQLDGIGRIVGEAREGRDDELYRTGIRIRNKINRSSGTVPEILAIFALLAPDNARALTEYDVPAVLLLLDTAPPPNLTAARNALRTVKAGGVRALLHTLTSPAASAFALDGVGPGLGLGDSTDATAGGMLSTIQE